MVTLPPLLVSNDFGICSYQYFLSSCTPVSLHMSKCSWAHTLTCLFVYCSFASIGHDDIMWSIVSSNCWQSLHLLSVSVLNILLHSISFVALGLVLPLFHFQFLFLGLPSIARERNVSSSLMSCVSIFLMYCPCITLFFQFSFKTSLNLAFLCCVPSLLTRG